MSAPETSLVESTAGWFVCGDEALAVDPTDSSLWFLWNPKTGAELGRGPIPEPLDDDRADFLQAESWRRHMEQQYGLEGDGLPEWLETAQEPLRAAVVAREAERAISYAALNLLDLSAAQGQTEMLVAGACIRGLHHLVYGEKEGAKTWWTLAEIVRPVLLRGEAVVWIDREMTASEIALRLRALGVEDVSGFKYLSYPPLVKDQAYRDHWLVLLEHERPALVVADAQAGVLAAADLNENQTGDVLKWDAWYLEQARARGAASVMLDHVGHENQSRARGAYGKGAAAKVEFLVEKLSPFDRETEGLIRVTRKKNTLSADIPEIRCWRIGGTPLVYSAEENPLMPALAEEAGRAARGSVIAEAIRAALAAQSLNTNALRAALPGHRGREVVRVAKDLVVAGILTTERGPRNSIIYSLTESRSSESLSPSTESARDKSLSADSVGLGADRVRDSVGLGRDSVEDLGHWRD